MSFRRYRDRGGIDYGADYGDNYSSYANGGGGLAGGYGLSSRSNPEIAHRKVKVQGVFIGPKSDHCLPLSVND